MPTVADLRQRLKEIIVSELMIPDLTVADIDDERSLFDSGLALDSVDALQLVLAIEKEYDIRIDKQEVDPERMQTVAGIAAFVEEKLEARPSDPPGR